MIRQAFFFFGAVAAPALIVGVAPSPAVAQNMFATEGQYNTAGDLPAMFLEMLQNKEKLGYKPTTTTLTVDGRSRQVITQEIAWDNTMIDNGGVAVAPNRAVSKDDQWTWLNKNDPAWPAFTDKLKAVAERSGSWSFVKLNYFVPAPGSPAKLVVPVPNAEMDRAKKGIADRLAAYKQTMGTISASTTAGRYFPDAKVPTNLAGVRQAMLDYGNKERMTPYFRKLVGAKVATEIDMSKPGMVKTVKNIEGKDEPVFPQPDLKLDEKMNETAQWFAEALAVKKGSVHQYTADGGMWQGHKMIEPWDRAKYFGAKDCCFEIAAPGWDVGGMPYGWMAGDTHYRWLFGVDGTYPLIGYGAAQGADGGWYYVGVAIRDPATAPK